MQEDALRHVATISPERRVAPTISFDPGRRSHAPGLGRFTNDSNTFVGQSKRIDANVSNTVPSRQPAGFESTETGLKTQISPDETRWYVRC
jgi:hypothetical protein